MTDSTTRESMRAWGAILLLSALYTLAMFPGLEWHGGYTGRVYKMLHPESLAASRDMTMRNPVSASAYYLLAKLVGDLWLDDRFTIMLYFLLALFALIGLDKIAQALGARRLEERLLVVSMMAVSHPLRDNVAVIVTRGDFYGGTFAGPLIIWLFALTLANARLRWVLTAAAGAWAFAPKWAWMPTLMVLAIRGSERLGPRNRWRALAGLVLAGLAAVCAYVWWIRPPGSEHVLLFDFHHRIENTEANPFLDTPVANLRYLLLLGLALFVTPPSRLQASRARIGAVLGALLFLGGGLYLTFTPDAFKIAGFVSLAFNRATQWPQLFLYPCVCMGAIALMRAAPWPRRLLGVAVVVGLEASFAAARAAEFLLLWGLVLCGALAWRAVRGARRLGFAAPEVLVPVSSLAVLLVALIIHGKDTVKRAPALRFLAQHGVIGDNPSAQWVGVDEWVRRHTPLDAVILPIATYDYPWRQGLRYNSFLRTRTGRSMPYEPRWDGWFHYDVLRSVEIDGEHMDRLIGAWKRQDLAGVTEGLGYFRRIDYIIVDSSAVGWIQDRLPGYRREAAVGRFTVLSRARAATDGGDPWS